jgi:hypothetical protein
MEKIIGTTIVGIMFIFIFVILPVIVGVVVEFLSNIITIDFIMKVAYIMLACSFICILKK